MSYHDNRGSRYNHWCFLEKVPLNCPFEKIITSNCSYSSGVVFHNRGSYFEWFTSWSFPVVALTTILCTNAGYMVSVLYYKMWSSYKINVELCNTINCLKLLTLFTRVRFGGGGGNFIFKIINLSPIWNNFRHGEMNSRELLRIEREGNLKWCES